MSLAAKQMPWQLRLPLRFFLILLLVLPTPGFSQAQQETTSSGERVIVCMIQIEHADAEYLASVLEPFLSPEGSIVPYKPTNTLIVKDRAHVVNMLAEAIKGKPCKPISERPSVENGVEQDEAHLDR